ncbi:MAG TPA: hypothetical protein VHQ65_01890 [Thermoanaerobaculia bacterium]|nr:hypothetical protein [Thermoanaerobaculia bacterium]
MNLDPTDLLPPDPSNQSTDGVPIGDPPETTTDSKPEPSTSNPPG